MNPNLKKNIFLGGGGRGEWGMGGGGLDGWTDEEAQSN